MRLLDRRAALVAVAFACLLSVTPREGSAQGIQPPDIVATRAIVVDAATGDILLDHGANEPVAMASLTKLFTAFIAIETTPLDRPMTVSEFDLVGEASMGIWAGEELSFETLLHGMLLPSGNDAATAIARNLGAQLGDSDSQAMQRFIDRANTRLATLGLHNTHLVNPHGLDAEGHYSTARDIAALTLYALENEPTVATVLNTPEYVAEGHAITNTNRLLGIYDGLIGGKTGVTDNAGYCLMQVAERDGRRIISVLLGSTPDSWYDDAEALLDFGFEATAVPGAATRYGQISFASAPIVAAPASQPVAGLAVASAGSDTAIVSQIDIVGTPRRSPWLWIVSAAVLAPVSLLTLSQLQRGLGRSQSRRRPARTAAPRHGRVVYHTGDIKLRTSQPDVSITTAWQNISPDYRFDETTDWRLPSQRPHAPEREHRPRRYPSFAPSYGGD